MNRSRDDYESVAPNHLAWKSSSTLEGQCSASAVNPRRCHSRSGLRTRAKSNRQINSTIRAHRPVFATLSQSQCIALPLPNRYHRVKLYRANVPGRSKPMIAKIITTSQFVVLLCSPRVTHWLRMQLKIKANTTKDNALRQPPARGAATRSEMTSQQNRLSHAASRLSQQTTHRHRRRYRCHHGGSAHLAGRLHSASWTKARGPWAGSNY